MKIATQVNRELIYEVLLELAAERMLLVVGSYSTVLERLNHKRLARGYPAVTVQALRTPSFRRALADAGGQILPGNGPIVIPVNIVLTHRRRRRNVQRSEPEPAPAGEPGTQP